MRLHHGPDFSTSCCERVDILSIQNIQSRIDLATQVAKGQEFTKGVGCGGKTRGHLHASGQIRDHFTKTGIFATHRIDIAHSEVFKRDDQIGRSEKY